MSSRPQTWRQWLRACARDAGSPADLPYDPSGRVRAPVTVRRAQLALNDLGVALRILCLPVEPFDTARANVCDALSYLRRANDRKIDVGR